MEMNPYPSEIYRLAIEEYVKVTEDKAPYVFIYSNPLLDSVSIPTKINGKPIVLVKTDAEVFSYVEKVALVLEIEPVIITDNELTVKINHDLLMELEYPFDIGASKEYLSSIERKTLDQSILRARERRLQTGSNSFSSWAQHAWTYVKFSNALDGHLNFVSIETLTK